MTHINPFLEIELMIARARAEEAMEILSIPSIPEEAKTCGFCDKPCGNEWCCMNKERK